MTHCAGESTANKLAVPNEKATGCMPAAFPMPEQV